MIYTENTKKAIKLAYDKHHGQFDKEGLPYIHHPFHLAECMTDEDSTCVALLHDVLEDTDTTIDDIVSLGFNTSVIEALKLLNHDSKVDYYSYVANLSNNILAVKVKIADLKHNSDLSRVSEITDSVLLRKEKYDKCLSFLEKQLLCLQNNDIEGLNNNIKTFLDIN